VKGLSGCPFTVPAAGEAAWQPTGNRLT
jgi:hypothetical protein